MMNKHLRKGMMILISGAMIMSSSPVYMAEEAAQVEAAADQQTIEEEARAEAEQKAAEEAAAAQAAAEAAAKAAAEKAAAKAAAEEAAAAQAEAEAAAKAAAEEAAAKAAEEAAAQAAAEEAAAKAAAEEAAARAAAEEAAAKAAAEEAAAEEAAAKAAAEEAAAKAAAQAAEAAKAEEPAPAPAQAAAPAQAETLPEETSAEPRTEENKEDKKEDKKDDKKDKKEEKKQKTSDAETEKPVFTGTVKAERKEISDLHDGDKTTLVAKVENANLAYKVRWESKKEAEPETAWKEIGKGEEFVLTVTEENSVLVYRTVLTFDEADEVASEKMKLPALKALPEETKVEGDEEEIKAETEAVKDDKADTPVEVPTELPTLDGNFEEVNEELTEEIETGTTEETAIETVETETAKEQETETEKVEEQTLAAEEVEEEKEVQEINSNTNVEEAAPEEVTLEEVAQEEIVSEEAAEEEEELGTLDGSIEEIEADAEVSEEALLVVRTKYRSNIRTEAGGLSEIFAVAPEGTEFKVLAIEGDWIKVEYNGRIGYTFKTNVDGLPEEEPSVDENGEPIPVEKKVMIFSSKWTKTYVGEHLALSSILEGFDDCEEIKYQWMVNKGEGFEKIEGATADTYYFTADEENIHWGWKLMVYFK